MNIKEIKGLDGYLAFTVFNRLLISLQAMPQYAHLPYRYIYNDLGEKSEGEIKAIIRELLMLVDLDREDTLNLIRMATDSNGIAITNKSIDNYAPDKILEIMEAVCFEISKIRVKVLTPEEIEALPEFSVNLRKEVLNNPDQGLETSLNVAFGKAYEGD